MKIKLGKRLHIGANVDLRLWGLPLAGNWSRYEIAIYLLCVFVQADWFPVDWDDEAEKA